MASRQNNTLLFTGAQLKPRQSGGGINRLFLGIHTTQFTRCKVLGAAGILQKSQLITAMITHPIIPSHEALLHIYSPMSPSLRHGIVKLVVAIGGLRMLLAHTCPLPGTTPPHSIRMFCHPVKRLQHMT